MRPRRAILLVAVLMAAPARAASCGGEGGETVVVQAVTADADLQLTDGRLVRLAGVEAAATPERPALGEDARRRLADWLAGRTVRLVLPAAGADRWGRLAGLVEASVGAPDAASGPTLSVAVALADAGLARARPEAEAQPCWAALLAAEAGARQARLGLWQDPAYAVLDPANTAGLEAALGTFVLVEGRVRRVSRGRTRVFVRLGERGADVSFSIGSRDLFILDQVGLNPEAMVGTRVRVRGVLEQRTGYAIDVVEAEQIEALRAEADGVTPRP